MQTLSQLEVQKKRIAEVLGKPGLVVSAKLNLRQALLLLNAQIKLRKKRPDLETLARSKVLKASQRKVARRK